jgi:EAL domain-containing protein (putative c-di-GMP-specific phosphodiesterase class I)
LPYGEWNAAGAPPHKVAVNLSARQFQFQDLAAALSGILAETGCRPEWLELEITESLLLEENDAILHTLSTFKSMGVSIAIDDFGTGYSALGYLTRFPIDTLKIDRSFIRKMTTDPRQAELVKAILSIAHCLGLQVVAEGVETAEQAAFLRANGCQAAQGFLFGRPVPKAAMALSAIRPANAPEPA